VTDEATKLVAKFKAAYPEIAAVMTAETDNQLQRLIDQSMPEESKAWHLFQDSGHYQGDVPRDVFQRLFDEDGHDEALRLCTHPERPFKGVPLGDQPRDLMDAWERFLAAHRARRPSP
jgi:hypothetical protein